MKVGVVSDVHANEPALAAGLAVLDGEHIDHLVVLGDLLSYGARPLEVIERLQAAARTWPTTFLIGNHDQLYFELQRGDDGYFGQMHGWIKESARWTVAQLADLRLEGAFPWQQEWLHDDVLFTHANPFAAGDRTYLNAVDARERAAVVMAARALKVGVFGHTHRRFDEMRAGARLLNPGSLGQPRDVEHRSTVATLDGDDWRGA